jgi:hypothetical protein
VAGVIVGATLIANGAIAATSRLVFMPPLLARMVAGRSAVNVTVASPAPLLVTTSFESVPAVVENCTSVFGITVPSWLRTVANTVTLPPLRRVCGGFAVSVRRAALGEGRTGTRSGSLHPTSTTVHTSTKGNADFKDMGLLPVGS